MMFLDYSHQRDDTQTKIKQFHFEKSSDVVSNGRYSQHAGIDMQSK